MCLEMYTFNDEKYSNIFKKNFFLYVLFNEKQILLKIILKMYNFDVKTSTKQL